MRTPFSCRRKRTTAPFIRENPRNPCDLHRQSADKANIFQYGSTVYGPYTVKEDPTAIPKDSDLQAQMTGIELRCDARSCSAAKSTAATGVLLYNGTGL